MLVSVMVALSCSVPCAFTNRRCLHFIEQHLWKEHYLGTVCTWQVDGFAQDPCSVLILACRTLTFKLSFFLIVIVLAQYVYCHLRQAVGC
jgi:hypothetical protein